MNINLPNTRKMLGMSGPALARLADISRWRLTQAELGNLTLNDAENAKIVDALRKYCQRRIDDLKAFCE